MFGQSNKWLSLYVDRFLFFVLANLLLFLWLGQRTELSRLEDSNTFCNTLMY